MTLEVHPGRPPVEHLHAVRADVAHTGLRIFREYERERNEASAVFRPALENGEGIERPIAPHDFVARRVFHAFGQQVGQPAGERDQFHRVEDALWHWRREQLVDFARQIVERRDAERQAHALHGPEDVRHHRHVKASRFFEEERRSAARRFTRTIGDRSNFEVRVGRLGDPLEELSLVEVREEISQVRVQRVAMNEGR